MKKTIPLLLLLAASCASGGRPHAPVRDLQYNALGHDPFWLLSIGDDRIVLTLGHEGCRADGDLVTIAYPRTLPRDSAGVRTWESGDGNGVISVEARPGTCEGSGGMTFEHHVRVRLSGRELIGCGGRQKGAALS
ncbi:hypothetical protein [Allosphingosinicella sp.]|jgi:uncharacterized membrane protein|uniref:hypothetical protein n=1 Tax=Allosphingosinicella sp. TaxID=2823234 RepID=UPI002EE3655C